MVTERTGGQAAARALPIGRRGLLVLAAAGVVGAVPAAATRAAAATTAATTAGLDLAGLARALHGPLILPDDARYPEVSQPYNLALGVRRPAAVAQVADRADVQACVRRVRGHGVPLAARSGGHSYAGYSTPTGGVVVDVSALRSVTVRSNGTAVIGAGARLGDVYAALAAHGRALPGGSCPTVGIAGLTLGGGIGVLSRAYGLTCDHLLAATVVTADGGVQTVNSNHDADLFWALRGGGGGNGGIVTDLTFGTVPAPTVTVFTLRFPPAATARVLRAWSSWTAAAPTRLSSVCAVGAATVPTNRITGTWTGGTSGLDAQLSALVAAVGVAPTGRTTRSYRYLDAMRYFAGGTSGRQAFRAASRMLEHSLGATAADRVVELAGQQHGMTLLFDSLRGRVAEVRTGDTAFAHRNAVASVQVYSGAASNRVAVAQVQRALAPLVGRGAYVNYLNPGQTDWASAYYGANLPRLRRVIRKYDPDGVLGFAQSVLRA